MFEKWRIKEHMEVVNAAGQHVGTVDSVDGDTIKLTRTDSADGQHHYVDMKWVDKIHDDCVHLDADTPLVKTTEQTASTTAQRAGRTSDYDGNQAARDGFGGETSSDATGTGDAPLFGTSGHGTGMGGSGQT